jgi:hypothetical protein
MERLRQATQRLDRELRVLTAQKRLREALPATQKSELELLGRSPLGPIIAEKRARRSQLTALRKLAAKKPPFRDRGTPEAASKPSRKDPIAELGRSQRLDPDQVRAALEIRQIYEAVSSGLRARTLQLSLPRDRQIWRMGDMPASLALARRRRFMPWAERLRASDAKALDIALRIAVFGVSVYAVSRLHKISWRSCVQRLSDALDQYWGRNASVRNY